MNILIVNVNWIGDLLFSTPAIRAIRKRWPDAHIACWVPARCAPVLRGNPYLDEVLTGGDPLTLRRRRFDAAFLFHRSRSRAFQCLLAGIPKRFGYSGRRRDWMLTHRCPPADASLHRLDYFLNLVRSFGIEDDGRSMDFFPKPGSEAELDRLFGEHGIRKDEPYAVMHPGGNWDLKRWPPAFFKKWARLLIDKTHWRVIVCGTAGEASLAQEVLEGFSEKEMVSLSGKTSLDGLAVLLKRARLLISNDSGPIHVAATQGTPIVGVFGPTLPEITGPPSEGRSVILRKDVGCEVPCYFRACNYRQCLDLLSPEEVFERSEELLR